MMENNLQEQRNCVYECVCMSVCVCGVCVCVVCVCVLCVCMSVVCVCV